MDKNHPFLKIYTDFFKPPIQPRWTTEYPTKPGYYWLRNYTRNNYPDKPEWNEMEPGPDVVEIVDDLDFYFIGYDVEQGRDDVLSAEWYGPIQPPK